MDSIWDVRDRRVWNVRGQEKGKEDKCSISSGQ